MRCEGQTGYRVVTIYNAVSIPRAIYCPRQAEPGSKFCPACAERVERNAARRAERARLAGNA